ncbi:phage replisome organizer N-terminal domain-containing protein [Carnobacterium jeotgali]|uniref:phage replisome organizer N-terminal domain-containing protein n=1 Tax=Carnobacterium jeotgali TaxID=545534 RepID=UPI0004933C13|nr:phage replisome organizer N-terminal domain-containing protein [Carnobacterium jeotgali]
MADNKKYYYIKLKENFFETEEMIVLESMPDGYKYSNILLKMYLKSLKHDGKVMLNERIPYNSDMLASVTRHSVGDVEKSIKIFRELGLIETFDNGTIFISDIQTFIGKSSTEAERKKQYRERIKAENLALGQMSGQTSDVSTPEIELEKEIELDIELEKEIDNTASYSNKRNQQLIKELKESSSSNLFKFYEDNGFGTLSSIVVQSVDGWLDDITDTGTEVEEAEKVVLKAMTIAVFNNARNWNYVNKILINWEQKGLNTVASIDAAEKAREKNKNKGFKQQPIRKETLPDWAKSDYQESQKETSSWTADKEAEFQKLARGE